MKKLLFILIAFAFLPHFASATTVNFNCAKSGGTLVATNNWTSQRNNVTQSSSLNTCLGSTAGDFNDSYYSGSSWGNDQQSTVTVNTNTLVTNGFDSIYVIVRDSGALSAENFYDLGLRGLTTGNVSMVIYKEVNGSNFDSKANLIGTSTDTTTYAAGDTFSLKVVGTTLTAYHNGVQVGGSFTDNTFASGKPGLGMFANSTGNAVRLWTGDDAFATDVVGGYTPLDTAIVAAVTGTTSTTTNITITPAAGSAVIFNGFVSGSTNCFPQTPTASGLGLTWTLIAQNNNGASKCMASFVGTGTPSAGKITFTDGTYSFTNTSYSVYSLTGVDANSPVVQGIANANSTCQSQNVTYSTTFLTGSAGVAAFDFGGGVSATIQDRAGWGQDFTGSLAGNSTFNTQTLFGADTVASSTATVGGGFQCMGVAGEIRASSAVTPPADEPFPWWFYFFNW